MRTEPKQHPVIIRGVGLVTPLGHSAWETMRALLAGRTIADRAAALSDPAHWMDLVKAVGSVALVQHCGCDPSIALAEQAVREALFTAGPEDPTPIVLGASKGAVHALSDAATRPDDPNRARAVALGPHGYLSRALSDRLGMPVLQHVVAACASSLAALHTARMMLHRKHAPRQIVVATSEAALLPMFVASYRRLGVLPPLTPADYRGRPLNAERTGFMLVQVGAALVLERAEPQAGDILLLDTAVAADAHDMIRSSSDMAGLRHVAGKLITGRTIDLLHPHATGTVDHDPVELAVYRSLDAQILDAYACKGAIGHGLGAAGLSALAIACLCARTGRRPPMPWINDPLWPALNEPDPRGLKTHAVFAAGFGGHVAGAVIQRV